MGSVNWGGKANLIFLCISPVLDDTQIELLLESAHHMNNWYVLW